jgi:purine-binding chemotaxis protein CheW
MADTGIRSLVAFKIDTEEFAVDIGSVQEINRPVEVTRIPNSPPHVSGVMNLRGRIIPVVDLRRMLGFEVKSADKQSRIIVIEIGGVVAGFLVDSVSEVVQLPESAVEAPPTFAGAVEPRYVNGVGKIDERLLILLNLEKMFLVQEEGGGEPVLWSKLPG